MTRKEIINEINCLLYELDNGEDAVSYLTRNDVNWLNENIKALEQEPTTKNNLGVDCISREQAKEAIRDKFKDLPLRVEINTILNELPSVTP